MPESRKVLVVQIWRLWKWDAANALSRPRVILLIFACPLRYGPVFVLLSNSLIKEVLFKHSVTRTANPHSSQPAQETTEEMTQELNSLRTVDDFIPSKCTFGTLKRQ